MLPHSVVTVSVATAYFTRMSQHAASKDMAKFKVDMTTGLKVIALVSMISTAMLIVLSYPIARVFAGEYPATAALGNVVAAFMIGLVPFSFVYMMQRAFFALEDTKNTVFLYKHPDCDPHHRLTDSWRNNGQAVARGVNRFIDCFFGDSSRNHRLLGTKSPNRRPRGLWRWQVANHIFLGHDSGCNHRSSSFELAGWHWRGELPGRPSGNGGSQRVNGWICHAVYLLGVALVIQGSGTQRGFKTIDH